MPGPSPYDCSFADVPFRLPTQQVIDLVERYGLLDAATNMLPAQHLGRSPQALALPNLPNYRPRLGEFWYPCGMSRCAVFNGIATGADAARMADAMLPTSGTFAGGMFFKKFRMQADGLGGAQKIESYMLMLPPRPLAVMDNDITNGLYLVTLIDNRYFQRFSLADPGFTATCSAATNTNTWPKLLTWYCNNLLGYVEPVVSADYGQPEPDSPLYGLGERKMVLIDAIAANIGGFITKSHDGNYSFQTWNAALTATKAARLSAAKRVAGGAILNPDTAIVDRFRKLNLPQTIYVQFPKWIDGIGYYQPESYRSHYKAGNTYGSTYNLAVNASGLGAPYATAVITVNEGFDKTLCTTAKAIYASTVAAADTTGGAPSNNAAVTALATHLAKDYYDAELAALDEVYEGIQDWPTDTGHDILWTWTADMCSTRVMRRPFDSAPADFQHGFGPLEQSFFNASLPARSVIGNSTSAAAAAALPDMISAGADERALFRSGGTLAFSDAPRWVAVPSSAGAAGVTGQMARDSSYLYVCTATNTWERVAIAGW